MNGRQPLVLRGARGVIRNALVRAFALIIVKGLLRGFQVVGLRLPKYFIDILDVFNETSNQEFKLVQALLEGVQRECEPKIAQRGYL